MARRKSPRERRNHKKRLGELVRDGVYVDARFIQNRRNRPAAHIGVVVYRRGGLVKARCERVEAATSFEAEALAVVHGLKTARGLGIGTVYTDALNLAEMIAGKARVRESRDHCGVVAEAKSLSTEYGIAVVAISRDLNIPAHAAAARGTKNPGFPIYAASPMFALGDRWPKDEHVSCQTENGGAR